MVGCQSTYRQRARAVTPLNVTAAAAPAGASANLFNSPRLYDVLNAVIADRLAHSRAAVRRVPNSTTIAGCTAVAARDKPTPFHALRAPSVTPAAYLQRLMRHAHCSRAAFVTAMMYIERAAARRAAFRLCDLNCHRLLVTAVLLATKFLDDILYDNAHFAFVGGLDVAELNALELHLLKALDYRLYVPPSAFGDYQAHLVHAVISSPNHVFDDLRLSLATSPARKKNALPPSSPISVTECDDE